MKHVGHLHQCVRVNLILEVQIVEVFGKLNVVPKQLLKATQWDSDTILNNSKNATIFRTSNVHVLVGC